MNPGPDPWYNGAMATNEDLHAAEHFARALVNAAIDRLLQPFRGEDGNCRRPDPNNPALISL